MGHFTNGLFMQELTGKTGKRLPQEQAQLRASIAHVCVCLCVYVRARVAAAAARGCFRFVSPWGPLSRTMHTSGAHRQRSPGGPVADWACFLPGAAPANPKAAELPRCPSHPVPLMGIARQHRLPQGEAMCRGASGMAYQPQSIRKAAAVKVLM